MLDMSPQRNDVVESRDVVPRLSIAARQKAALLSMLTASTQPPDPFESADPVWKVLIYDQAGRDILAPLLPVSELRAAGVTLHMLLHASRHPIPDVPAIYFIRPTRENLARVAADASAGLYSSFSLNFTRAIARPDLEAFAADVSANSPVPSSTSTSQMQRSAAGRISRVFDMYADFHALDHSLFTLAQPGVYSTLNARTVTEAQVDAVVDAIVDGLFCALVSLPAVPLIRAQRAGPAWLVADRLDSRLRDALKAGPALFSDNSSGTARGFTAAPADRPILVLADRSVDLAVMLHHTWTYRALAHEALGLRLNRVTVPTRGSSDGTEQVQQQKKRVFDLGGEDEFWTEYGGKPFPVVAEAVESALQRYQGRVAELNRSAGAVGDDGTGGIGGVNANDAGGNGTADALSKAISNIPELAKQKRLIDTHTNIATALLDEIKARGLDGFFQVEEELLARPSSFDIERILALLRGERGSADDKLRAFLIYYLCVEGASTEDIARCVSVLKEHVGLTDLGAYEYLKSVRMFSKSVSKTGSTAVPLTSSNSIGGAYALSVLDTLSQVANNVNKLIVSNEKASVLARDVSALMDGKSEGDVSERYGILDPKLPKGSASIRGSGAGNGVGGSGTGDVRTFKDAIVFVVGPGNYIELQSCQDHVCSKIVSEGKEKRLVPNGRTVVYGATELCNGGEFLKQLHANGGTDEAEGGGKR